MDIWIFESHTLLDGSLSKAKVTSKKKIKLNNFPGINLTEGNWDIICTKVA